MRSVLALGLALGLALASSPAAAQSKGGSRKATSADDEVARGLFQAGKAAYQGGKYEDALSFLEQAHARSGRPELLFNIGQAADRLRQDEKALEVFRAYLTQVPSAAKSRRGRGAHQAARAVGGRA